MKNRIHGFTLIELLVVIAIVAILSVVVVLTLNPAQLLAQSRDSNRTSDMATLKTGLSLYLADVTPVVLASASSSVRCYVSATSTVAATIPANCGTRYVGTSLTTASTTNMRAIDGTGWIGYQTGTNGPNFNLISAGAPFGQLPVDPSNTATYFYSYAADITNQTFKFAVHMESKKFQFGGGAADVEGNTIDGGTNDNAYEVGTNVKL